MEENEITNAAYIIAGELDGLHSELTALRRTIEKGNQETIAAIHAICAALHTLLLAQEAAQTAEKGA